MLISFIKMAYFGSNNKYKKEKIRDNIQVFS